MYSPAIEQYMQSKGYVLDPNTGRWGMPSSAGDLGDPNSFKAAEQKQNSDYDTIMKGYKDVLDRTAIAPVAYAPTQAESMSIGNLADLATSGGYSDQNIADIRARDISPIRSIYSSAARNVERQKALQGGYSPNYGAVQAKMAREMSDMIANKTTDVNANIAQAIAQNRIAASSPFATAAGNEATRRLGANEFNVNLGQQALEGARSIYGTTPALSSTFGNQVTQAAQLGQGQQELNIRRNLGALSAAAPMLAATRL